MTEDEMVGWHHWLDGHEFEQILEVNEGQGGLLSVVSMGSQRVCCVLCDVSMGSQRVRQD